MTMSNPLWQWKMTKQKNSLTLPITPLNHIIYNHSNERLQMWKNVWKRGFLFSLSSKAAEKTTTLKSHFDPCKDRETLSIKTRKWKCTTPGFTNKCLCTFQRTPCWMYNIHPGHSRSDVPPQVTPKTALCDVCQIKYDWEKLCTRTIIHTLFFAAWISTSIHYSLGLIYVTKLTTIKMQLQDWTGLN